MKLPATLSAALCACVMLAGTAPSVAQKEKGLPGQSPKGLTLKIGPPKGKAERQGCCPDIHPDVYAARREFGRALSFVDPARRRKLLREAEQLTAKALETHKADAALRLKLLALRARVEASLNDFAGAKRTVRELHILGRKHLGQDKFNKWLTPHVAFLRRKHSHDLVIAHLSLAVNAAPDTLLSGRRALLIGDALLQRSGPRGRYDLAIRQFAHVAKRYRDSYPDIADDAQLRQAKALLRNEKLDEARELLAELEKLGGSVHIRETAEHYLRMITDQRAEPSKDGPPVTTAAPQEEDQK